MRTLAKATTGIFVRGLVQDVHPACNHTTGDSSSKRDNSWFPLGNKLELRWLLSTV
jgi:hypothetical protein